MPRLRRSLSLAGFCLITSCAEFGDNIVNPHHITVSPAAAVVYVGQDRQMSAQVYANTGAELQFSIQRWTTSDSSIATVTSKGVLHGVAPGIVRITAQTNGALGETYATVRIGP